MAKADVTQNPQLTDYSVSLDGVYLPSQNALLSYEPMLAAWEEALDKYTDDLVAFAEEVLDAKKELANKPQEENFLNLELEALGEVPIDPTRENLVQIVQQNSSGSVTSMARDFLTDSDDLSITKVESESTNLFYIPRTYDNGSTTTQVVVSPPAEAPPTTPRIVLNSQNTHGMNDEAYLNTGKSVVLSGNLFKMGASFGGAPISMDVLFQDNGAKAATLPAKIILTSLDGNTLTLYTANGSGHVRGDFEYTLSDAIVTPTTTGPKNYIIIDGKAYFEEEFTYILSNEVGSSKGSLIVQIADDRPVATDQQGLSTLDEANIANLGSNGETSVYMLAGSLIHPSTNPLLAGLSDNRIGPDGGVVSNVTLVDTVGATDVIGITTYSHTFTQAEVDFLEDHGFIGSTTSDEVIFVTLTDVDGGINYYKVDTVTGHYLYVFNDAFHQTSPDTTSTQIFEYTFVDNEYLANPAGQSQPASAKITLTFQDDAPEIEVNSTATPILNVDETNFGTDDANFAVLFDSIEGADGATIEYSLSINGTNSGLTDTLSNQGIVVSLESGDVVGKTIVDGAEVFRITIDSNTGEVELSQSRSVRHSDITTPNETTGLPNSLISIIADITDEDGSTDSASKNIGSAFTFKDDGPEIQIDASALVPVLVVDDTNVDGMNSANANFAALFITTDFGNDGFKDSDNNDIEDADAVRFQLNLSGTGVDSGLDDSLSGDSVLLYMVSGDIVGRVGSSTGSEVFRISLDENTGSITLNQSRAVVHNDSGDPDEATSPAQIVGSNVVTLTAIMEDGDGDVDETTIDISGSFRFKDDGPTIEISSEATPTLTVDDTDILGMNQDSADFSILFTGDFGKDGFKDANDNNVEDADAIRYVLGVSITDNFSGLIDTLSNSNVLLYLESGDVVGRAGSSTGDEVFRISLDENSGEVTLSQTRAVRHDDANDPNEASSPATLAHASLVTITATIEDGDGDTDTSETKSIGDAFQFKDDGPSISVSATATPTLTADESTLGTDPQADFSVLFTGVFGADGFKDANNDNSEDADAIRYALNVKSSGVDSGIDDTLTGLDVLLYLESGSVVGRVGSMTGSAAFTISIDANSGQVTLNQMRAVEHDDSTDPDESASPAVLANADLITLTATIEDGDNDTANVTKNIGDAFKFEDDGPTISLSTATTPTLTADETMLGTDPQADFSGLFTGQFGADSFKDANNDNSEDADAIRYALNVKSSGVDSGINDTITGLDVLLYLESGSVVGRVGSMTGSAAFTISIDANSGQVTLNQLRAVEHSTSDPDESTGLASADLVSLTATIEDGDGDTNLVSKNIADAFKFKDDGPTISLSAAATPTLTADESTLGTDPQADFSGLFTGAFGADGFKDADNNNVEDGDAIRYSLNVKSAGIDSGIDDTATGNDVVLFLESGVVVGRVSDAFGAPVFTLSVDADTGFITLNQIRAIEHDDSLDPDESASPAVLASADLVNLTATIEDGDGDTASVTKDIGDAFKFEDDGPSIDLQSLALTVDDILEVDESNFTVDDDVFLFDNFTFTSSFGADGGLQVTDYALSITGGDGTNSGLKDTDTGEEIHLFLNNAGEIEGRTATSDAHVFTIWTDVSGRVSLDQLRAVMHPNVSDPNDMISLAMNVILFTRTDTVTDGDGDQAQDSASIDISQLFTFKDDGPDIQVSQNGVPSVTVDETILGEAPASADFSGIFTSDFGADGTTVDAFIYALTISGVGVNSGLVDTQSGANVLLYLTDGEVIGTIGASNAAEVFRISVDSATGEVTLLQSRAVIHDDSNDPDEESSPAQLANNNLISLTATIIDGDGDTDSQTRAIGAAFKFEDDGPTIQMSGALMPELIADENDFATDPSASFDQLFVPNVGSDVAVDTLTFALSVVDGTDSGLNADGENILLYLEAGDVVGRIGSSVGNIVFTILLDETTGEITLDQSSDIDGNDDDPVAFNNVNLVNLTAFLTDADGDTTSLSQDISAAFQFEDTTIPPPDIGGGSGPVVLDLNGDNAINLISPSESSIDLEDIFLPQEGSTGWVGPDDGFLMYDPTGSGEFTSLNQIAFTAYLDGAQTDLEGLIAFDSNENGLLDVGDQSYSQFGVWQDKNTNAHTDEGEYQTLAQMGIVSINLTSDHNLHVNDGNIVYGLGEYQTVDGKSHVLGDVELAIVYDDVITDNNSIDMTSLGGEDSAPVAPEGTAALPQSPTSVESASAPVPVQETHLEVTVPQPE